MINDQYTEECHCIILNQNYNYPNILNQKFENFIFLVKHNENTVDTNIDWDIYELN